MSHAIDQARALLAVLGRPPGERGEGIGPAHALGLASELIICGEWQLAFDLCELARNGSLSVPERVQLGLVRVDCLINPDYS